MDKTLTTKKNFPSLCFFFFVIVYTIITMATYTQRDHQTSLFAEERHDTSGKSKPLLVLLSTFFGFLSVDRFYMGCYKSGFIKLCLLLFGIILMILSPGIGIFLLLVYVLWTIVDFIVVIFNALIGSRYIPVTFCSTPGQPWESENSIQSAQWLTLLLVIIGASSYMSMSVPM